MLLESDLFDSNQPTYISPPALAARVALPASIPTIGAAQVGIGGGDGGLDPTLVRTTSYLIFKQQATVNARV